MLEIKLKDMWLSRDSLSDPSFLSLSSGFHLSLRKVFTEKKLQIALAN